MLCRPDPVSDTPTAPGPSLRQILCSASSGHNFCAALKVESRRVTTTLPIDQSASGLRRGKNNNKKPVLNSLESYLWASMALFRASIWEAIGEAATTGPPGRVFLHLVMGLPAGTVRQETKQALQFASWTILHMMCLTTLVMHLNRAPNLKVES